jgi:hypothetical protein
VQLQRADGPALPAFLRAGQEWRGLPRRAATMRVLSMAMFKKIVVKHDVGMGEAYMDGDYAVDNLGVGRPLGVGEGPGWARSCAAHLHGSEGKGVPASRHAGQR